MSTPATTTVSSEQPDDASERWTKSGASQIVGNYSGWGKPRWWTTQPARDPVLVPLPDGLPAPLRDALIAMGRTTLYSHQAETIEAVRTGKNVLLVTSTASGKTLAFNAAILDQILREQGGRALYIYPLNALANDQAASISALVDKLPAGHRPRVGLVTGQSNPADKRAARDAHLVLTNPETVHFSILQRPDNWRSLLGELRFIVIDEAHMYRGAFGAHVSHVVRRLQRVASRLGAHPQVIAASATIGNPLELAHELTGRDFALVDRDGSARGEREIVVWQPPKFRDGRWSPYEDDAVRLFVASLASGRSAMLFARSRRSVESLTAEVTERLRNEQGPDAADAVKSYRGGYTGPERKEIEEGLRRGAVRGVVTTNALEVGIDIGSLDVVIIAGYPGTMMAFWQQGGRAGRRGRTSQIFYVPSGNPLDEYFADDPQRLIDTPHESATFDPWNPRVAVPHVLWRAQEAPIRASGPWDSEAARSITERLAGRGALALVDGAYRPTEPLDYEVSLRSIEGRPFRILDSRGRQIGEVDEQYLYRECHPGAIYAHQGRAHRVTSLDEELREVVVEPASEWLTETRAVVDVSINTVEELATRRVGQSPSQWVAALWRITVTERYVEYREVNRKTGQLVATVAIDPPLVRNTPTVALVVNFSAETSEQCAHAIEHALQALIPTEVMCDRRDFVGLTTEGPVVYLYDRNIEGLGFAERAFERLPAISTAAADRIAKCACRDGCPLCIHSSSCERWNDGLSKSEARLALDSMLGIRRDQPARTALPLRGPSDSAVRRIANEVADELVTHYRKASIEALSAQISDGERARYDTSDSGWVADDYAPGLFVHHAAFGAGIVKSASGSRHGLVVSVDFAGGMRLLQGGAGYLTVPADS